MVVGCLSSLPIILISGAVGLRDIETGIWEGAMPPLLKVCVCVGGTYNLL